MVGRRVDLRYGEKANHTEGVVEVQPIFTKPMEKALNQPEGPVLKKPLLICFFFQNKETKREIN